MEETQAQVEEQKVPTTPKEKVAALAPEKKLLLLNLERQKWLDPGPFREKMIQLILGISMTPEELYPEYPGDEDAEKQEAWASKYLETLCIIHEKMAKEASLCRLRTNCVANPFISALENVFGSIGRRVIQGRPLSNMPENTDDIRFIPEDLDGAVVSYTGAVTRRAMSRSYRGSLYLPDYIRRELARIRQRFLNHEIDKDDAESEAGYHIRQAMYEIDGGDFDESEDEYLNTDYDNEEMDTENSRDLAESLVEEWEDDLEDEEDE